jgi:hypothetical protein
MQSTLKINLHGTKKWVNNNGELHREDGPAVELWDGSKAWYINGKRHRIDGPALEDIDGYKAWYINGNLHREDGPAVELNNGTKYWFLNGKKHRIDGPAIECSDDNQEWYIDGNLHRIDGPAIYSKYYKFWYLDGKNYTEKQFNDIVNFPKIEFPYIIESNSIYHIKFKENIGIRLSHILELYIDGEASASDKFRQF